MRVEANLGLGREKETFVIAKELCATVMKLQLNVSTWPLEI